MRNDKLSVCSMDFAVEIIALVKDLKLKKALLQIRLAEAEHRLVQTYMKLNMLTEKQTLYQKCRLH